MNIKKTTIQNLIATLATVDNTSRRKNLTGKQLATLMGDAVRAIRSALTILRKMK